MKRLAALLASALAAVAAAEPRSAGPVVEPSGIACLPSGNVLVVGDEGSLAELRPDGTVVRQAQIGENLEDVAWHAASSRLVAVSERRGELVLLDADLKVQGRVKLDAAALLGRQKKGGGGRSGFEGVAFLPGGELLLVHQRQPAMIVTVAFDPAKPPSRLDGTAVKDRWTFDRIGDVTAATWSKRAGAVLVVADARDRLLTLAPDGSVRSESPLPGTQQEGLCEDASGALWIADDRGRTLHHLPASAAR